MPFRSTNNAAIYIFISTAFQNIDVVNRAFLS